MAHIFGSNDSIRGGLNAQSIVFAGDEMEKAEEVLGLECYGYGNWKAPFWFVGPEQGQSKYEGLSLTPRYEAFLDCNTEGLSDSREFHHHIGEYRWHREDPALQSTWRRLMLLLMTYCNLLSGDPSKDDQILRKYQRDELGMETGRTCLIELSGIPARSFAMPRERECFREERLLTIRRRLLEAKPEIVVIYGKGQWKYWKEFPEFGPHSENIVQIGKMLVAFALHPHARGTTDNSWIQLGQELRRHSSMMS